MYEYNCTLDRVVDGDTVDVNIDLGFDINFKTRVRLLGINCPEVRTRDNVQKMKGLAAKNRVKELLVDEFIIHTVLDKRGKYGRVLGTLIVDGQDINQLLIEEGHAVKS